MLKDIAILGVIVVLLLPIGLYLSSSTYQYQNDASIMIDREPQSCKINADCKLVYSRCDSEWVKPVSRINRNRYEAMEADRCENKLPKFSYSPFVEKAICEKNKCEIAYEYKPHY